jgi:phosphoenolpyruvate carboxykinase (ATP)
MLGAALSGELEQVPYAIHPIFDLQYPTSCPNVPAELLDPRQTWIDRELYDEKAKELQAKFNENASKFEIPSPIL